MSRQFNLFWLACSVLAFAQQTASACVTVSGDQITGLDVAAAVPQMAVLPPDLRLGYAPVPGVERVFRAAQLQQLANRYGINTTITTPVCFAWSLHLLSKGEIATAIHKTLGEREIELKISDQSRVPVPAGELNFPLQGLSSGPKSVVWNGYVEYAGNRKFNTWVQVQITIHEPQVIATRPIRSGELLDAAALKEVDYRGPLRRLRPLQKEAELIGKCARGPITAGTILTDSMLSLPQDVEKEQLVTVHTDCGGAHIETQGIATDSGYRGDVIRVKNPKTGRVFRARIVDRGMVTVVAGGSVALVVEDKKS